MKALTPKQKWEYVPLCDRNLPKEEQVVFILKPLIAEHRAIWQDHSASVVNGQYVVQQGTQNLMLLNFGLDSVNNLKDYNDNPVVISRNESRSYYGVQPLTEEFLAAIPYDIQIEVATEIYHGTTVGETEVKN